MGSLVSATILSGDTSKAHKLSLLINLGGKAVERFMKKSWNAKIIILGGDDIMAEVSADLFDPDKIEAMRAEYHKRTKATLSCGIGLTPEEAMKAIVIAKNTGKDKAVFWVPKLQSTYDAAVKARINDLRTKLKAQSGLTEGEIPADMKAHVRKELRKLLRARDVRRRKASTRSKTPAAKPKPSPAKSKPSRAKPKVDTVAHKRNMLGLLRDRIIHHRAVHTNYMRHADMLSQRGEHGDARAMRMASKLHFKKMMRDRNVLHAAAEMRDPTKIPKNIRSTVKIIRTTMASRMKRARAHTRQIDKLAAGVVPKFSPIRQLKSKPSERNVSAKPTARVQPKSPTPPKTVKNIHASTPDSPKTPKISTSGKSPRSPIPTDRKTFNVRKRTGQ